MIKWLMRYMEKHFTEKEIREIIERDLPEFHLAKNPPKRKGGNTDEQQS